MSKCRPAHRIHPDDRLNSPDCLWGGCVVSGSASPTVQRLAVCPRDGSPDIHYLSPCRRPLARCRRAVAGLAAIAARLPRGGVGAPPDLADQRGERLLAAGGLRRELP